MPLISRQGDLRVLDLDLVGHVRRRFTKYLDPALRCCLGHRIVLKLAPISGMLEK